MALKKPEVITLETIQLPSAEAHALAQFFKRINFNEMRENAVSDEEAYEIRNAINKIQYALHQAGFNPR